MATDLPSKLFKSIAVFGTKPLRLTPKNLTTKQKPIGGYSILGISQNSFAFFYNDGTSSCHCSNGPGNGPKRYLSTVARTGDRARFGYVPNATYTPGQSA